MGVTCQYCGNDAKLVSGDVLYPHRPFLRGKQFWQCEPCDAYVGCHLGTTVPLGTLANRELRKARKEAHNAFDPLWESGRMSRKAAYAWLSDAMHLPVCHIGQLQPWQCRLVVEVVRIRWGV